MHKKRLLTLLLVVCMVFGCLAPAASAANTAVTIEKVEATDTASSALSNAEKHVVSGAESSQDAPEADASGSQADADAVLNNVTNNNWIAELVDASVDLTASNSCLDELEALASEYQPNEKVAAFVVLEDAPLAETYSSKRQIPTHVLKDYEAKQKAVVESIEAAVGSVEVVYQFNYLTNAVVIETEFADLSEIAKLDGVASVFVSPVFYPATTDAEQMTVTSGQMTNVDDVWNLNGTGYTGSGMTIAILDTGLDLDHPSFAADPEMTADSWTKDTVQALIDAHSDTDVLNAVARYSGTLTADDVYYSAKVPFIFNYAMGNTNVLHNDTVGDHGTHVAGIAAANEVEGTGVVGMAPDAQVIVMKVFNSSTGGANLYDFVAALEDCILMDIDVANLSLGSAAGFSSSSYAEVDAIFDRIADSGLIVNIAAGNESHSATNSLFGEKAALTSSIDNSTVASPSTYDNVMSIGSVDNAYVMADYFTFGDGTNKVFYQACVEYLYEYTNIGLQEVLADQTLDYVIIDGLGEAEDFYDAEGNSLVTGKVAVVKRGTINFSLKVANAEAAGAVAVIVWNNVSEDIFSFGMSVEDPDTGAYPNVPAILISLEDGQKMADAENKTMTVVTDAALRINSTGGQISSFSSWGASADLRLLPDLSGIGGNVYSCYDGGEYGLMSGTSMATPQVSGVSALVKQYLNTVGLGTNEIAQALMMSTANVIIGSESGVETSPRQQGAGLVDALKAVTSGAYLTVDGGRPKAELGDSADGTFTFTFEIHNFSDSNKTYALSSSLLCEDYVESAYYTGLEYMAGYDTKLDGTVSFSSDTVTVIAGGTAKVTVTITVSEEGKNWIKKHFENGNYVEGYIYLTDTAEEGGVDMSLPFMGFYSNWSAAPIFDTGFWYNNSFWAASVAGVTNTIDAEEYWHVLWLNMGASVNDWILGLNPYSGALVDEDGNIIYSKDNNVVTPNGDGVMDNISDYYLSLLRNCRYVWLTYTDEEGNVLDRQALEYESKTMYNSSYGATLPSVYSWYYDSDDLYDFTDADGNYLPDGTKVTLTISAVIDYDIDEKVTYDEDGNAIPVKVDDYIEIPITVDVSNPVLKSVEETADENGKYLTVTFEDAHPATVALMNPAGTQIYTQVYDNSLTKNADGTYSVTLEITGRGDEFLLVLGDYGYNEAHYNISREVSGDNDPVMDTSALYAYQVYNASIYYYYGWDYMFGWTTVDKDAGTVTMINSDAYEYYAINAAEYVDGYVFAIDAGGNFLYMTPGLWNRNTICNIGYNVIDMAFDDTTGTMYILISDSDTNTYALATLDLLTGEVNILKTYYGKYYMPWAMTFVDGNLYCCKNYYSGFYQVDMETYLINRVTTADGSNFNPTASTGFTTSPSYGQSMTYSKADGKIYWLYCSSSNESELIAIDPTNWTSEATYLGSAEYIGALTLEDTEYHLPESTEITDLAISDTELLIAVGKTAELNAYALPWNAPAAEIVWTSSNDSVATVKDGVVTGVGAGSATITASIGETVSVSCSVNVIDVKGTFYAYDYSGDGTYGSWQSVDLATMVPTNTVSNDVAFLSAAYNGHDGYIYGYDSNSFASWKMNAETGEVTQLVGTGYDDSLGYVSDMAYDYSTGIMYAVMNNATTLYAMNMYTGKLVPVADMGYYSFSTLACDLEGNLYGMTSAGELYHLSIYETEGGDDGDSGIGGWEPLYRELNRRDLDDDMGVGGDVEETNTTLAVELTHIMDLDVSVYGYAYYGQSMCYDYANDVILWCYTDGNTFRWIDINEGFVYDLGSTTTHSLPQYLGMYTIPETIPELEPVYVESVAVTDMFLLIGSSAEPTMDVSPVNVNQTYIPYYELAISYADDGSDDDVIEIVDGKIVALKAGTAYVNAYAVTEDFEDCYAETYFRVTVKNATSSDIRMFEGGNLCWLDVDQYDVANPTFLGYASLNGAYLYLYSSEYVDSTGLIYSYGYDANDWAATFQFMTIDPATMEIKSAIDMGAGFPFVYDLEFDYTTGTMYALAGTSDVVSLYYVNLATGELIKACSLEDMYLSMTIDAEGTIYLMSRSGYSYVDWDTVMVNAKLYTVDETTGEVEFVLDTGVFNPYVASLGYDYDTGYLYWTPYENGLYLIDLNDMSVNRVGPLDSQYTDLLLLAPEYPATPDYLVDAVMLTPSIDLVPGSTGDLSLFTKPSTVATTVSWYSGDETIATVDENGTVTGVSAGITTVYALVSDGTNYIVAIAMVYVYGENEYFLSYNATDKGFATISRQDPTVVTNVTEGESAADVTAMVMVDGTIYAYDRDGKLFTTTVEGGFERNYIGSCGIDVSEYSYVESDGYYYSNDYKATFTVQDMTVLDGKILALGVIGYNVHAVSYWEGQISYEDDFTTEYVGGCGLYEVDPETGALTLLCTIYSEDGEYMSGAKTLAVDANGKLYVYSCYNDVIYVLDPTAGTSTSYANFQNLGVYGDNSSVMSMSYDELSNSLYVLLSTNGSFYRLFQMDVDTGAISEVSNVGEVTYDYDLWSYSGEVFHGLIISSEMKMPEHTHAYVAEVTPATCTANGHIHVSCDCGDILVDADIPAAHSWNDGEVTTEPTCTEEGVKTFTCSVCGETKTEAIPANGHSYVDSVVEATCTTAGYTQHTCSVCGDYYYTDLVQPTGHNYEMSFAEATCTTEGTVTMTCSVCGDTYTTVVAPATGHSYEAVVTEPTCTEDGYTTYTCANCGDTYTADETPATGHSWNDGEVTTDPTCTEDGVKTFTCSACGETKTEAVPATGHDYQDGVCANCGEEDPDYEDPFVNPFTDVYESDWYYDYVMAAAKAGLINGYNDSTFRPANSLTRAEAATLLYRLSGSPEVTETASFTDLPNEWYRDAIAWAESTGVVTGYPDGTFRPDETVTREQFVTMLWRLEGKPETTAELEGFEDTASVSEYAKTAFAWAVENGIINGTTGHDKEGTYLAPQDNIKRCEVAKILCVYCDLT